MEYGSTAGRSTETKYMRLCTMAVTLMLATTLLASGSFAGGLGKNKGGPGSGYNPCPGSVVIEDPTKEEGYYCLRSDTNAQMCMSSCQDRCRRIHSTKFVELKRCRGNCYDKCL